MPPDIARAAEVREWLERAAEDLAASARLLSGDPPLQSTAAFHCQQAVEKSEKALLSLHDRPFRRTHDLAEIGRACSEIVPELTTLLAEASALTEYAWRFRYPGEAETPTLGEVQQALEMARKVNRAILALVPDDAKPA